MINIKKLGMAGIVMALIIASVILAASGFAIFRIYRFFYPYLDREIVGPTVVSSQWMAITPKKPLQPERNNQEVVLMIEPYIKSNLPQSVDLVLPDGSVILPEVQLIDQDGNVYNLTVTASSYEPSPKEAWELRFGTLEPLPKDRSYRTVRVRSDKSIRFAKIYWRCYDPWDLK